MRLRCTHCNYGNWCYETHCQHCGKLLPKSSKRGPDSPEGVSGASDCSDPRSGADNRAALAAKRPIPPRVAGRNPKCTGPEGNDAP